MQILKIGVDSGGSLASKAFKPFHNILVNASKKSELSCDDVFNEIEFVQIIFVIGGKHNPIAIDQLGDVKKLRGQKARGVTISISNKSWQENNFEEYMQRISALLNECMLKLLAALEAQHKVKDPDKFVADFGRIMDEMLMLSRDNMKEKLTLIPEALNESYVYWKMKP